MKYSVIVPLYNKAPYVRKALESVFAQTYTDYELIVVDDGSTDDSACIVQQFIDERLKVKGNEEVKGYRLEVKGSENGEADTCASHLSPLASRLRLLSKPNAGVSAARNSGVAVSSGDYVAFLDADDWWEPTYLERMAQLIEDYPDAGLYASNYVYYKPGKTHVAINNIETGYFNYPKAYYEGNAMPVWTGAAIIPRRVFDETGGFPLGIKLGEDFLLWSKIALQYPVAFLNDPLAWYNNDVIANQRVTYNLHKPEYYMLFNLDKVFNDDNKLKNNNKEYWELLIDKFRLLGMHEYWLDCKYHNIAQKEIDKVDLNRHKDLYNKLYKTSWWLQYLMQKIKKCIWQVLSF